MDIVIIGAGNTASVLGRKFFSAGHRIRQVYNRHPQQGLLLAAELQADFTGQRSAILSDADLFLIALSDDSIPGFVSDFSVQQGLVVHTAGAVSREILRNVSASTGVLYPLQTLRRALPAPESIPMLIDASGPEALDTLKMLCKIPGMSATVADDATRSRYHLAAVVANNFSNHFFALAESFCQQEKIDFKQLLPLLTESVRRLQEIPARDAQTGPAVRKDAGTIEKHLALLAAYPELRALYQTITLSIGEMHG